MLNNLIRISLSILSVIGIVLKKVTFLQFSPCRYNVTQKTSLKQNMVSFVLYNLYDWIYE